MNTQTLTVTMIEITSIVSGTIFFSLFLFGVPKVLGVRIIQIEEGKERYNGLIAAWALALLAMAAVFIVSTCYPELLM